MGRSELVKITLPFFGFDHINASNILKKKVKNTRVKLVRKRKVVTLKFASVNVTSTLNDAQHPPRVSFTFIKDKL